jgi:hypothetical protein
MTDSVSTARAARENLARGLSALQGPGVPEALMDVAEPVAEAMSHLHQIESSHGAALGQAAPSALQAVRRALAMLQAQAQGAPAVDQAIEAVAGSLSLVHALNQMLVGQPAPAPSPQPAPGGAFVRGDGPAGPHTQPSAQQPYAQQAWSAPAQQAAQVPAYAQQPYAPPAAAPPQQAYPAPQQAYPAPQQAYPAPQQAYPAPQQAYPPAAAAAQSPYGPPPQAAPYGPPPQAAPQGYGDAQAPWPAPAQQNAPAPWTAQQPGFGSAPQQPATAPIGSAPQHSAPAKEPAYRAPPDALRVEAELGAHSPTNFYKGLSGNDVIDSGGIFVATYKIPPIGQNLLIRVSLPGGYEFEALGVVEWTRDMPHSTAGSEVPPGFGAKFTQITAEGRQLVYRYVRNREPLFHDDL